MSDEEDYSSEESSVEENISKVTSNKPKELSLADNDDDYDIKAFQRPDLNDIDGEGEYDYEEDGEDEESEFDASTFKQKSNKTNQKTNKLNIIKRSESENGGTSAANSRMDIDKQSTQNSKIKKKKKPLFICLVATKYDCVHRVAKKLNFKEVGEDEDWFLYWTDTSVSIDRVNQMKRWQKINHFPGMSEICRKDFLTRNMNRMIKSFPKDYNFYPKAWCLPADYADFSNYARQKKNKTYICKPDSGCQGRGIFITKNPFKDIKPGDNYVVQVYVSKPFTVDSFKFDLRVYVAVTSCDPFRIFVYKEGLARFTTQPYEEPSQNNCKDVFMHLTNYAIQKRSDDFLRDEDTGTKRRISTINKWLKEHNYDVDKMWNDIDDVVIKTIISAQSVLKHNYRTCFANHYKGSACFEILGFDILLDKKLKPYVLEVNHSPSFTTDSRLDREIKDALIYDTIMLLNIGASDKKKCVEEERKRVRERLFLRQGRKETKEELEDSLNQWLVQIEKWENKHMGNYRRIYPTPGSEKYEKFFSTSGTLFSETAASKARLEQAKQQMEEIQRKNEKILGSKSYRNNVANKEVRGESPARRQASQSNGTLNRKPILNASRNSLGNSTTNNSTYNINSSLVPNQQQQQLQAQSQLNKQNRINYQTATNNQKPIVGIDTMKPFIIDETEELERIQGLKQRENLLKGMGINEFIHRILFGTPGTMATMPPVNNLKMNITNLITNATQNMIQQQQQQQQQQHHQQQHSIYHNQYFQHDLTNNQIAKPSRLSARINMRQQSSSLTSRNSSILKNYRSKSAHNTSKQRITNRFYEKSY